MPRPSPRARRVATLLVAAPLVAAACRSSGQISEAERRSIADSLQTLVRNAYDFTRPDPAARFLALYPDSGRVISATAGHVSATQRELAEEIHAFWENVGQNMQGPRFELGSAYVDVITRDAVVMTFTYSIPHHTPRGREHVVSGAWTTFWRNQNGKWRIVQEHLSDTPESVTRDTTPVGSTRDSAMADTAAHRHH